MKSGFRPTCLVSTLTGLLLITLLGTYQEVQAQTAQSRKVVYECELNHPNQPNPEYLEVTFAADGGSAKASGLGGYRDATLIAQPSDSGFYFLETSIPDPYKLELRGTWQEITYGTSRSRKVCKLPGQARTEVFACNLNYNCTFAK